jgi:predicted aldo/keto reductase-like oxidoreductase
MSLDTVSLIYYNTIADTKSEIFIEPCTAKERGMIYKELCGEKISNLGMGNMRLPTRDDGHVDEPKAREIIRFAYEHGVNYFDTAYPYHNGESEPVLGRALADFPRESWHIADKFRNQSRTAGMTVKDFFEIQLGRCGVDYFDYYLIHNVSDATIEDYLETDRNEGMLAYFESEKAAGRIRHLGFSCHAGPENLERFLDYHDFDFVQIQCNYLDWVLQNAKRKYEIMTERNIPIVVMESCRGGRLADLGEKNNAVLKGLRPDDSIASWAYRYLQNLDNVKVILSGMSTLEQAADNVNTFGSFTPMTDAERKVLDGVVEYLTDMVPCTACRYCQGCPMGLDIPGLIALYNEGRVNMRGPAAQVGKLPEDKRPGNCIGCGACMKACPQGIKVPEIMKDFDGKLKEYAAAAERKDTK